MEVRELKQLVAHLESLRTARLAQQQLIGKLILPSRGLFQGEDSEGLRNANLLNNVAQRELRKAAAGMTQAITPASNPWFRHAFLSREDRELTYANEFVDAVDTRIRAVLSEGGFYQAIHAFNKELIAFGCALLFCESSPTTVARFFCQTCGTYSVALDAERNLECVARRIKMTAREIKERFDEENISSQTKELLKHQPYQSVDVVHVVQKRESFNPENIDVKNMPYASWWYEEQGNTFLKESGFRSMPFFFTVWEDARGIYGTGPGDEALGLQKGIEAWEKRKIVGIEKMIDPPLLAPGSMKRTVRAAPGEIISDTGFGQSSGLRPLYEINFSGAIQHVQAEVENASIRLQDIMMANIFAQMSLETRPAGMTMTEYMDRRRRSAELMGPTVSSYEPRVLNPLLERVYLLLDDVGMIPIPPDGLSEWATLDVSYQSPMAQMLEQSGAVATSQFLEAVLPVASASPEVLDKIDFDQLVDELAQRLGVPASIVRSDEQVAQIRQERAQQQAMTAMQQQAMQATEEAAQIANISTDGTVAGELIQANNG